MLDFGFYNMDCMEGMKQFPDKYFDLAVVDPPYGDASGNEGGVLEQIRPEVRQVQADTYSGRTSDSRTEHGVMRTGGTWAEKFSKKLFSGTLPRISHISMSCSASHGPRLFGGVTTSICRRHGAS